MPNICSILLARCIPHGAINLTLWLLSSSWASTNRAALEPKIEHVVSHCDQILFKGTWQTSGFSASVTQGPDLICLEQSLSFKFAVFFTVLEAKTVVDILFTVLGTDWKKKQCFCIYNTRCNCIWTINFEDVEDKFISGMVIRLNMSPLGLFSFPFIFLVKNF